MALRLPSVLEGVLDFVCLLGVAGGLFSASPGPEGHCEGKWRLPPPIGEDAAAFGSGWPAVLASLKTLLQTGSSLRTS